MRLQAFLAMALTAFALSGCGDVAKPNLSLESLGGLKLTGVEIVVAPDASVHFSDAQDEAQARAQAKAEANEPAGDVQTASAEHQRERAAGLIKAVFLREIGARLRGARPVVARILVKGFMVPSGAASVVVGVGSAMTASVDPVDAKSGQVLESRPAYTVMGGDGGGLIAGGIVGGLRAAMAESSLGSYAGGKAEGLAVKFTQNYAKWLFER